MQTFTLLKKCFVTQGDFYREVGITNFKTFQPDWQYFTSTSSEGWRSCINKIVADARREDVLRRIGQLIANKIGLFTQKVMPVTIATTTSDAGPGAATVNLTDITGKNLKLLVGNKLFVAHDMSECVGDSALVDTAKGELEANANAQVKGFESEFSNGLALISKQYEKQIKDLKDIMKTQLPAMDIPTELLREHIQVTAQDEEYRIYIPIHLHYKYITTDRQMWKLKKEWQYKQDGLLMLAVNTTWNLRWSWLYDKDFRDNISIFHSSGNDLCLGTYQMKIKSLEDVPRIRDDIAVMLEKIYTRSIGADNLNDKMRELYEELGHAERIWFDDIEDDDKDYGKIATRMSAKDTGGAIWST